MGQDSLPGASPVDFLYLDKQRVASFAGQLSDKGMMTGYKASAAKASALTGQGEANVLVAKGGGGYTRSASESSEETYDPFWTYAYSVVQELEANQTVPLSQAVMGSMIRFEALIQFLDLRLMRNLWEPSLQMAIQSQPEIAKLGQMPDGAKIILQIMKEIPPLFHMTFLTNPGDSLYRFWAAVQPSNLTIESDDLTMKFGTVMDGLWTVVGIVDGRLGEPPKPFPVNPLVDGVAAAMISLRQLVGRPNDHFGLTPIAIYSPIRREFSVKPEAGEAGATEAN